jgi:hypothetical protein
MDRDRSGPRAREFRGCLANLLSSMVSNSLPTQTKNANSRTDLLSQFSTSLDALALRVSPSEVQIHVDGLRAVNEANPNHTSVVARGRTLGSGVIVDPEGQSCSHSASISAEVQHTSQIHKRLNVHAVLPHSRSTSARLMKGNGFLVIRSPISRPLGGNTPTIHSKECRF